MTPVQALIETQRIVVPWAAATHPLKLKRPYESNSKTTHDATIANICNHSQGYTDQDQ